MSLNKNHVTRRGFLGRLSWALLSSSAFSLSCREKCEDNGRYIRKCSDKGALSNDKDPSKWWEQGYIIHENVDTSDLNKKGIIRAYIDDEWQSFKVKELPGPFIEWNFRERKARLERMVKAGGMDPRDLAGPHNACVATYGGPSRDSSVALNTAYKGMGFVVHAEKIAKITQRINEEKGRIMKDTGYNHFRAMLEKAKFLAGFYDDISVFDRTKQVSLELFTSTDFHTHTFLNMMSNPIASASFLAFPTFEIRAIPQLLHPQNPYLSRYERDVISFTNEIHDFVHSGLGERMVCIYHVIELFNDTPNEEGMGKRIL